MPGVAVESSLLNLVANVLAEPTPPSGIDAQVSEGRRCAAIEIRELVQSGALATPYDAAETLRLWRHHASFGVTVGCWAREVESVAFSRGAGDVFADAADILAEHVAAAPCAL